MRIGSMPSALVDDVGDVGAEDDEGRMRDIDDVENAERDRDADGDGGIEAAEQKPGDQGIDQEIVRNIHASPRLRRLVLIGRSLQEPAADG